MDSSERLSLALAHKEADRIPFDLGGTVVTGIHKYAYQRLRELLGLPEVEPVIADAIQQIVVMDEEVNKLAGTDIRRVAPGEPTGGGLRFDDRQPGDRQLTDEWGIGWRMPDGGFYYDMHHHPLAGEISLRDLERYPWPDPCDPARFVGLRERARRAKEEDKQGVVLSGFCSGILETAAWLRGYEDLYADLAGCTVIVEALLDKITDLKLAYWEKALKECGEFIQVIQEADDLGGQERPLISPATYKRIVKPYHKRLFQAIKAKANVKVFFHSCGAIRPLIPDLIEAGVDILNPVQVSAMGMGDTAALKRDFGDMMTFWGGGVDTQSVLDRGTPGEVRDEVHRRIDDLAPGGGFVFAAVHNIQASVPAKNILAMLDAVREYGGY